MTQNLAASKILKSAGYSSEFEILEVVFLDGAIYQFYNVPKELYDQFMKEKAKSKFFSAQIRNTYPFSRTG